MHEFIYDVKVNIFMVCGIKIEETSENLQLKLWTTKYEKFDDDDDLIVGSKVIGGTDRGSTVISWATLTVLRKVD